MTNLEKQVNITQKQLAEAIMALVLISSPVRSDGTYNRDRKACEQLANETLTIISKLEDDKSKQ